MSERVGSCWHCGHSLGKHDYGRESLCLDCHKPTRVCTNCCWYMPGAPNDCREPVAERVMEKERANFCGYFEPADRHSDTDDKRSDLLDAAEGLFK